MKQRILQKLKENTCEYVSGAALSRVLSVSRTAVWKHILELKKEGYIIESSPKKGYKLTFIPDLLNSFELTSVLKTKKIGRSIHCLDVVDSTNTYAKKLAYEGCQDGTVVTADMQTSGRGRLGRTWSSLNKSGLWMSVVLRPSMPPEHAQVVTLAVSVAVVRAINSFSGILAGIKWPNDIILDGKKVCGILTEMSSEMDRINSIVVGIGINLNQDEKDFEDELKDKATSLRSFINKSRGESKLLRRSSLIKDIAIEMDKVYERIENAEMPRIIGEWRKYSITIGKEVMVTAKGIEYKGVAQDVTDDGKLVIRCEDGITREFISGEVRREYNNG